MKRGLILAAILFALASPTVLCAQTLEVVPGHVLVDETAVIRASGLQPHERVSIQGALTDGAGAVWTSEAEFIADAQGVVDTSKQAPVAGSYDGICAMGLVLFMKTTAPGVWIYSGPRDLGAQTIQFQLLRNGEQAASAQLEQRRLAYGVRQIKIDGQFAGILFLPNASGPVPGVLVVGGAQGGIEADRAAWLASHGYAALALAYFRYDDLPRDLAGIPLEYFGRALDWMAQRPEILADQIAVMGTSRGGELVLQLGSMYPQIKAVVAYVPSSVRNPANGGTGVPYAWTWQGQPLPYLPPSLAQDPSAAAEEELKAEIPVEKIHGPILLISGGDDKVWDSTAMADAVVARLKRAHFAYRVENLKYAHAGHLVGFPELVPVWRGELTDTVTGEKLDLGGSVKGNAESSLDAIPKVLEFLSRSLQPPAPAPPKQ
jgi:dienelactone hydrolase